MDEMPIRAGRTGPGKMWTAWFRPVFGDRDEIAFPFRLSRENGAVPDLLGDLKGTPLSDGSQACAAYAESRNGAVRRDGCRSRARREFEKAKDSEPGLAAEAPEPVGGLLLCERKIRKEKLEGREKLEFRRSRALPVAEAFWKWCRRHCEDPRRPPKSPIAEALDCVMNWRPSFPTPMSRSTPSVRSAACGSCRSAGRTGSSAGRKSGRKPSGPSGARSPRAGSGVSTLEPARSPRPANLRPSLEPRRGARAEKMEGSIRRQPDGLRPRDRSDVPRFRNAGGKLRPEHPEKSLRRSLAAYPAPPERASPAGIAPPSPGSTIPERALSSPFRSNAAGRRPAAPFFPGR